MKIEKKYLILILIELALLLIITIFILLMQSHGRVHVQRPLVFFERPSVTYLVGSAEVRAHSETAEWQQLTIGQALYESAELRTGNNSRLDIRLSDGTAIRLESDTVLQLDSLQTAQTHIRVQRGMILGRFRKRFMEQEHIVRSESAIAGVRGTSLTFEVADDGTTTVSVLSGLVDVYSPDKPENGVQLYPGSFTVAAPHSKPAEVLPLSAEDRQPLEHLLNNIQFEQVLLVSTTIQFESNTDTIMAESKSELEWVLNELQEHSYSIRIDGHTADVGTRAAMQSLSVARAERIREYLIGKGIPARRLQIQGFGSTRPLTDNTTADGRARNRRVEFIIVD